MFDKNLRILIIEPIEKKAICIDKNLTRMGYYCIASTTTLIEGLILNNYGTRNFDVMILPEHMIDSHPGKIPPRFFFNIGNLFIYDCTSESKKIELKNKGVVRTDIGFPEYHSLEEFMACVVRKQATALAKSA